MENNKYLVALLTFLLIQTSTSYSLMQFSEEKINLINAIHNLHQKQNPKAVSAAIATIKKIADEGTLLNIDLESMNLLAHAVIAGKFELANYLLDKGADPTLTLRPGNKSLLDRIEEELSIRPSRDLFQKSYFLQKAIQNYYRQHYGKP